MKNKFLILLICSVFLLCLCGCNIKISNEENGYFDISELSNVNNLDIKSLFMYDNKLYIKSNGVIDFLGCDKYVGKIDTLIDENYVPKNNGETNNEKMLNANICYANDKASVIEYNNEFVLFDILK